MCPGHVGNRCAGLARLLEDPQLLNQRVLPARPRAPAEFVGLRLVRGVHVTLG